MAALREAAPIARWCATARETATFSEGLFDRMAGAVPFDGGFLAAVDPATLLYTRAFRRNMPAQASPVFIRTELTVDDINQLRQLARTPCPVGWLDAATRGNRMASLRYRDAMLPFGLGDELRVALCVDGQCWGLLCLHREHAKAGFERRDAALLAKIAPNLAVGLRQSLLIEHPDTDVTIDGPGVAVLGTDRALRCSTAAAARWFDELADLDHPSNPNIPTIVLSVIEGLNASGADKTPGTMLPQRARVRAPSGQWLTIHAARLDDDEGSIAVIIEPITDAALAPLIVAAYGLTRRERDVAARLLAGLARKTIAAELRISQHTVNDHVKAVFDKTGASSTGQLRAIIFQAHHARPRDARCGMTDLVGSARRPPDFRQRDR
jgi:DNA-binding CsgD family transcriptional regulator